MGLDAMTDHEDPPLLLERSARMTRGKRMTTLLDEEIEEDEQFWNQDALKDEDNDDNYVEDQEVTDEFDSDFDDDEPEQDSEDENPTEERIPVKKRLIFPGKATSKKKIKRKVASKVVKSSKADRSPELSKPTHDQSQDAAEELEAERTVRKSTRTSVIVRQAEREAIRAALQATMKPIKRKKEGEEKRMTQEEMLLEAAQTEIMNLRNLERVLAREEEVKKRAIVHKAVYDGPQTRFTSRNGQSFLEFSKGSSFKAELRTTPAQYPQKSVCVVTGLPARYRDPKTGLPFATKEAFKIIRERFLDEEAEKKQQGKMIRGDLLELLSSEGSISKRRRSGAETTKPTDWRLGARFRRIPALENFDLD